MSDNVISADDFKDVEELSKKVYDAYHEIFEDHENHIIISVLMGTFINTLFAYCKSPKELSNYQFMINAIINNICKDQ